MGSPNEDSEVPANPRRHIFFSHLFAMNYKFFLIVRGRSGLNRDFAVNFYYILSISQFVE